MRSLSRATALVFALALLASQPQTASGASKKGDSFTARAYPFVTLNCGGSGTGGIEGVTFASKGFTAPTDGVLTVSARDFAGDWDLAISKDGEIQGGSYGWQLTGDPPEEELKLYVRAKTSVVMHACNTGSSQLELVVTYRFATQSL